jgi:hypothetical protein
LQRQVADIVFVKPDRQLLIERQGVETRGLTVDFADLRRRYAVIDNEVETDLGQREAQLFGAAWSSAPGASAR